MYNDLVDAFNESIFDTSIDICSSIADMGLECLEESSILSSIPYINLVYKATKGVLSIQNYFSVHRFLKFVYEFNAKTIPVQKIEKYKKKLKNKPAFANQELGRLLQLIDKLVDDKKLIILGKLFHSWVCEDITLDQMVELTEITDRIFITDLKVLINAYENNGLNIEEVDLYHIDRLIPLGLMENKNRIGGDMVLRDIDSDNNDKDIILTELGKLYCKFGNLVEEKAEQN